MSPRIRMLLLGVLAFSVATPLWAFHVSGRGEIEDDAGYPIGDWSGTFAAAGPACTDRCSWKHVGNWR
jgi:hypothetical protein